MCRPELVDVVLDISRLDSLAPQHDLIVFPADELDRPVRIVPSLIARLIQSCWLLTSCPELQESRRIFNKTKRSLCGIIQIAQC